MIDSSASFLRKKLVPVLFNLEVIVVVRKPFCVLLPVKVYDLPRSLFTDCAPEVGEWRPSVSNSKLDVLLHSK